MVHGTDSTWFHKDSLIKINGVNYYKEDIFARGDTTYWHDTIPTFCYTPAHDSLRRDPNFYIYKNGGVVLLTMKAYNWDSTSLEYIVDTAKGIKPDTTYKYYVMSLEYNDSIFKMQTITHRDTTFRILEVSTTPNVPDRWVLINRSNVAWSGGKWVWVSGTLPPKTDPNYILCEIQDSLTDWAQIKRSDVAWQGGKWVWVGTLPPKDINGRTIQNAVIDVIKCERPIDTVWTGLDSMQVKWDAGLSKWVLASGVIPEPEWVVDFVKCDTVIKGNKHPTYNRCKFCEQAVTQVILISDAIMNFVASENVCQGDSIKFIDSTFCNVPLISWMFGPISASKTPAEYPIGYSLKNPNDHTIEPTDGMWISFNQPNDYQFLLVDECVFECKRYDTVDVHVWPRSVPTYTSSTLSNGTYSYKKLKDILCLNHPDTLFLKSTSYTAYPFEYIDVVKWVWHIQNIGVDTLMGEKVSAVPLINGLGSVYLTVTNEKGCDSTTIIDYGVDYFRGDYVSPKWTVAPSKIWCNKLSIPFRNESAVLPASLHDKNWTSNFSRMVCEWDYGDGTAKRIDTVECGDIPYAPHTYNFPDKITKVAVKLRVWLVNNPSCYEEYIDTVTIIRPVADFTSTNHYFPCVAQVGQEIFFADSSEANDYIKYYQWIFGDEYSSGTDSTAQGEELDTTSHIYRQPGEYDVTLIVKDGQNCIDTMAKKAWVTIDGPGGTYTVDTTSFCIEHEVTFTPNILKDENSKYMVDSLTWLYDGATIDIVRISTAVSLPYKHTYKKAGMYLPAMQMVKWVTNKLTGERERCIIVVKKDTIWAIELKPDFITAPPYCLETPITFINTTEALPMELKGADSIYWTYGNGDEDWLFSDETKQIDGEAIYSAPGTYTVTLKEHYKTCIKEISKDIEVMPWPNLHFYPDTSVACDGLDVIFTAVDSMQPPLADTMYVSYEWRFDDSVTIYDNPATREFTQSNVYHFEVEVAFKPVGCVKTWEDSVVIFALQSPVAEFTADPLAPANNKLGVLSMVQSGESISFTDKSTPGDLPIDKWEWKFGDDETGNEQNPKHTYLKSGVLPVKLTVTDEYGCWAAKEYMVNITAKLNFPNIFTPVGSDGQKYVFKPLKAEGYFAEFKLEIYNKWGMLVWKQNCKDNGSGKNCPDYENPGFWWDGSNKQGGMVPNGVYYWVVYATQLDETEPIIKNGSVTVVGK